MKITVAMLKEADACKPQIEEFERRFGDEVEVTVEAAVAVAREFDWDWAAENLLPRSAWWAYLAAAGPAREAFEAAAESAQQTYKAAVGPAQQAYDAVVGSARQAFEAAQAEAFAECALEAGEWEVCCGRPSNTMEK